MMGQREDHQKPPGETPLMEQTTRKPWAVICGPVFYSSSALIAIFVILAVLFPQGSKVVFDAIQDWIAESAAWFYMLSVAAYLGIVVGLAITRFGEIKLGPDHSEPDYTYTSWFAMLFSAGMGIGLMFFGVAEPIWHFYAPPNEIMEGGTVAAAREAMKVTFFHWGIHAWAIYALVALSLAYFAYRHGLPLAVRSAFYPLIGDRIHGWMGHSIDTFAILATMFGVATSLGIGVTQVNAGLNHLFGVPEGLLAQLLLIAIITFIATGSVVLGLDHGIRRLSELNLGMAILLVVFVLILGPTALIFSTLVQNTGSYLSDIVYKTFNLYAYEPRGWIGGWTLFYWGWWIAWSPFVGMFIARISRGRTIREFVVGVLVVPVGFTFIWLTVFGNTAIDLVMTHGADHLVEQVMANEAVALFVFLEEFPFSGLMSIIATLLVITFFVTSSDSGSLVIDTLASGGRRVTPVWQRIYWATLEGVVAAVLLLVGGLEALRAASIASALPFSVIILFAGWGLIRALRVDAAKRGAVRYAPTAPSTHRSPVTWQQRLHNIVHFPRTEEVKAFVTSTVKPAMEKVARELRDRGMDAKVETGEDDRVWIEVHHLDEPEFFYSVRLRHYASPAFVLRDTEEEATKAHQYCRAEVYLREGSQNYDIMGWTGEQVIADVLDQYEKHLHFLHEIRA